MTITHTFQSAKSDGADTTVVQPSDWNAAHTIAEGYTLLRVASVTLTDAQIKALPTTAIQIVAAPGAGKVIAPLTAIILTEITTEYTNVNSPSMLVIAEGAASVFDTDADDRALYFPDADIVQLSTLASVTRMENTALSILSSNELGNFTGGNAANTLKVTVYYMVVDL
jgi:hypothetical protein